MIRKSLAISTLFLVAIGIIIPPLAIAPHAFALSNPCGTDPKNLIANGSMAAAVPPNYVSPYGEIAANWHPFALTSFIPTFEHVTNEQIDPNGSQYIWADAATFDAGIYQTVTNLTSGTYYHFWLGYGLAAHDPGTGQNLRTNLIGRQVGIDPLGGTDPQSGNVIWGTVFYNGIPALNIPALSSTFRALSNRATFFLRAINTDATGRNKIWFDSVCMEASNPQPTPTFTPTTTPILPTPSGTRVFFPLISQQSLCLPAVVTSFDVGGHPKGVATDPTTKRVYTALFDASSVTVVDANANVAAATWWLNNSGHGNGIGAVNALLFSSLRDSASVSILKSNPTGAFMVNRTVGSSPYGVGASGARAWVANFGSDSVSVFDTGTMNVIATRATGAGSNPALIAASTDRAFVSLWGSGVADIAGDGTLSHFYPLGAGSFGVAFNELTHQLYVSNRKTNQISIVNSSTGQILQSVILTQVPYALAIDPATNRVFVDLAEVNQIDVRDGVTLLRVALLSVGSQGMAGGDGISVMNGRVYVANNAAGTMTVIDGWCR